MAQPRDDEGYPLNWSGGKLHHSHSAAETLQLCARKYFYSYILRLVTPSSKAAAFGGVCHDLLEQLCKAGHDWHNVLAEAEVRIPNHTRVLKAVFPNLPWVRLEGYAPWPMPAHWKSETRVYLDAFGLKLKGFVDLWTYHLIPQLDPDKKVLVIEDLKVSGNPKRYCKSPDSLSRFGQPLKYAYSLAKQLGVEVDRVYAAHLYAHRTGRARSFVVNARAGGELGIPWSTVEHHWTEKVLDDTQEMLRLHAIGDPDKVSPSTSGCRAFGGCEYADICSAHTKNFIPFTTPFKFAARPSALAPQKTGEKTMSSTNPALAAMMKRAGKTPPQTGSPRITKQGAKTQLEEAKRALGDIPEAAKALMQGSASSSSTEPSGETVDVTKGLRAGLSPEAQLVLEWVEQRAKVGESLDYAGMGAAYKDSLKAQGRRGRFFKKQALSITAELKDLLTLSGSVEDKSVLLTAKWVTPLTATALSDLAKTSDIVSKQPEPKPEVEAILRNPILDEATQEALTEAARLHMLRQDTPPTPSLPATGTIYVGCMPEQQVLTQLDTFLADAYLEAEKGKDLPHWGAHKYGEGAKAVISLFSQLLKLKGPVPDLFIPVNHPLADRVLSELRRHNFTIIRGV